ncbi:MAG: DUF2237 domain-containing protein [Verrucomicrobiota bacterium]
MASNILGTELESCSLHPLTGFYRNGKCDTCAEDKGMHTVCAIMTDEFLAFSKAAGNDLTTPLPAYGFPGLKAGDRWCLCLNRWVEAYEAGLAPKVILAATHLSALEFIDKETLESCAADSPR